MRLYNKRLDHYGSSNNSGAAEVPVQCEEVSLIEVAREEHAAVMDLIGALKRERDAILSLSLKDITGINNEKEGIVKALTVLKKRREAYPGCIPEGGGERSSAEYLALAGMIRLSMREVRQHLRKNRVLLSLSASRVKSVMEFVAHSLKNRSVTYGREEKRGPVLFARRV